MLSGAGAGIPFRWIFILDRGRIRYQQLVEHRGVATLKMIGEPKVALTFDSQRRCWRPAFPISSGVRTFTDEGLPFPDEPRMRVEAPRRKLGTWLLQVETPGEPDETLTIDGRSLLVTKLTRTMSGSVDVERVTNLSRAPRLSIPKPRC